MDRRVLLDWSDIMDIAAMSTLMSLGKIKGQVNISVMKMAMDSAKISGQLIQDLSSTNVKNMEMSLTPHLGKNIDIKL